MQDFTLYGEAPITTVKVKEVELKRVQKSKEQRPKAGDKMDNGDERAPHGALNRRAPRPGRRR